MDVRAVEDDMLADLRELDDPVLQYSYLVACGGQAAPYPAELRTDDRLVRECQVRTWIDVRLDSRGRVVVRGDSESLAVRGALALLGELFDGRDPGAADAYDFRLLDDPAFARHFTKAQLKGLRAAVARIAHA